MVFLPVLEGVHMVGKRLKPSKYRMPLGTVPVTNPATSAAT